MATQTFEITVVVVHTPPSEAVDSRYVFHTVEEAAEVAAQDVRSAVLQNIPLGRVCSLVVGSGDATERLSKKDD